MVKQHSICGSKSMWNEKEGRNPSSSIISKVYGQRGAAKVKPKDASDEGGTGGTGESPSTQEESLRGVRWAGGKPGEEG